MTRDDHLHCARVYLAQVRHFRERSPQFAHVLLTWAANRRREAQTLPVQRELFGAHRAA